MKKVALLVCLIIVGTVVIFGNHDKKLGGGFYSQQSTVDSILASSNAFTGTNSFAATTTFNGRVGINTSTPSSQFQSYNANTSTISVDSSSATRGACLELKNVGGGYTYCYAAGTSLVCSAVSCK